MFEKLTILLFIFSSILQVTAVLAVTTEDYMEDILEESSTITFTFAIYEREIEDLDQEIISITDEVISLEAVQSLARTYYPISATITFIPSIFPPPEQPMV